jgi:hypothetical protein
MADGFPLRPEGFGRRVAMILGALGIESGALQRSLQGLYELLNECRHLASQAEDGNE